jgi:sulfide:quinone oxidoreductase
MWPAAKRTYGGARSVSTTEAAMASDHSNGGHHQHHRRSSVLIAGGGVAALEALLALRALAGDRVSMSLLCPASELLYRPVTVAEAFGRGEARTFRLDEMLVDSGATHLHDSLAEVWPERHTMLTAGGDEIAYDKLVIATGAVATESLPGALTFGGRDDVPALRHLLDELVGGAARSVAFTLGNAQTWTMPLYELALMTGAYLRETGSHARVTLVTPEESPLGYFGPEGERAIRPMLAAQEIALRCSARPLVVRPRELVLAGGGSVLAERVVTLPQLIGPGVPGIPVDAHGFIRVDNHGRVSGVTDVFAAGDVTSFGLKQGGLASQQADAVAEWIAHQVGAPSFPRPFRPVLRGLLITQGAPVYLRCEPQRLPRRSSVAIDERRLPPVSPGRASLASDQALWWPPAKIAARYLAPYLATARPLALTAETLADRIPVPGPPTSGEEFADAVKLALLLADGDADWGDYDAALSALDAAEVLQGTLPAEYETKRRLWQTELRASS